MIEKLEKVLVSAFPPVTITRAMIDEASANWDVYEDYSDLVVVEGKSWIELSRDFLYRHSALLLWAGDTFWRAVLPAYLSYLLHERTLFNDLPWQVASQLTRKDEPEFHPKFDRRTAALSREQRTTIRDVLAVLATVSPLEDAMSRALGTWNNLVGGRQ